MRELANLTLTMVSHFLLNYWFYVTEGPRCVTSSQGFDLMCLEQLVLPNVLVAMNRVHILTATRSSNKQVSFSYDKSEMCF